MKKFYAINGSPRKAGNTAQILKCALQGAANCGAETELIDLIDLNFSGCRSCFSCKLKGGASYGKCAVRDDLSPVLEKVLQGDGLILGTPIYFGGESGLFRNFIERLFFSNFRYDAAHSSIAPKNFPVAFVYTMNVEREYMDEIRYPERLKMLRAFGGHLFGNAVAEELYVCDTFQFDDYERYDAELFDAQHKAEMKKTLFPEDCKKAFALGERMAK